MSKHISTRRESRNGVSLARTARLPSGSLPLRKTWPISLCIGLAIGSIAVSADALAGGPTGGTVVGGTGSITQAGNETVINQISQKLALNWETFNLKANESVLFNQPGRSAVALNRILDQNPSQIFGKINSNGQVFLINTHGIIFGATAQMNVGGLMASTLDLTPKDFLAGNYSLNAVGAGAGIVNHGLIQAASGGSVALVGGSVTNNGVILANYGSINLDGAEHAVLDFDGNGLINIQITGELKQRLDAKEAAVSNTGTLQAEGGTVVLQASAAKDLFTNLVNNSGVIDASGISTDGGVVRLVGNGGNTVNSGSIKASGVHGGSVQLLSDRDVLVTGGTLDASGSQGGGAIRVGGGIRGGEGLAVAERTYVAGDAVLNADATGHGHGGSIAVFSRDNSVIAGSLSARGGVDGGNGGFIETSSHGALTVTGTQQVMARATGGSGGNWLIDPNDITIVAGNGHTKINNSSPFVSSNDGASLGVDLITAALTGGATVTVTTGTGGTNAQQGDITLNADLDYNGKGTNALKLDAAHDIIINNKIFDSTPGGDVLNLTLLAGNSISLNNDISLGTGSATLTATAGSISQAAGKLLSGGDLTLNAATGIGASGAIETSVDTLTFTNSGAGGVAVNDADGVTISGSTVSGDVNVSARTGDLTIGGDVSSADNVTLGAGTGNVVHSSGTVSGNIVHFNAWGTNGSIGASDAVLTKASQLSFEAKGTGVVNITEADGAAVSGTAVSGDVAITSTTGDLAINGNISTTGNVNLNAVAGSISRTAGGISGNALTLTAGGTNGAIGALDAIRTDVNSIVFGANGTGAVNITEANGVTVSGTAGSGSVGITSTTSDLGVATPGITTSGGDVTLMAAGSGARINIAAGAAVDTTNGAATGADVSLIADNADIFGTINAGTGGIATIRQATAGRPIALGGTLPTNLDLSDPELNSITANTIVIGDANSGAISIVGAISPGSANKLSLNSGSTISQTTGSTITVGTLSGASAGATTLGEANQITNLGTFSAASLTINNASALTLLGNVTTTGTQTYDAALLLGADRVLSGTDVTFNSTVDGGHALTVNASGITTFGAAVGGTTALTSLTTDAPGSTTLSGNVTTSGTQTWGDTVTLGSNATLTGTTVSLAAVTGGSNNLTVTGNAVLSGAVAGVGALQISGTTSLDTASVSTSGGQTYSGAVTLGGDATLASSGSGAIGFGSTVNGAHTLTVNTGGATSFGGAVGGTTALSGLTTKSGTFSAGNLTVNGPLSVTTTAGGIVQGAGVYAVNGTSTFNAGSNAITLASLNNFVGAVSLTGGTTQITNANALTLGTVQTGNLTVGSGGALNLGSGSVGGTLTASSNGLLSAGSGGLSVTGLASFTQNGAGADVDLSQANDFQGGVTIAGASINNLSLQNTAAVPGALTLPASVTGNLTLNYTSAALTFPLAAVTIGGGLDATAGGGITINGNVSTVGGQAYHSAVTLAVDTTLASSGNGAIGFGSTVNGAHTLTVNTGGSTSFGGAVGGTTALTSLTTDAPGSTTLSGNVSTSGAQTYNDAVTLGANATLASSGSGAIGFGSTVNGAHTLTVNTGGATSFGGAVGGTTALSGLTTNSGTFSAGNLTVNGPLSVTTTAGGIVQGAGVYAVNGTSTFNAGSNAITLTSLNNFVGAVSLTGGTTQINAANALTLGTLQTGSLTVGSGAALNLGHGTVAGNLSATSGTSITLNGALVGLGNVAFSGSAPGGTGSIAGTGSITGVSGSPFALAGPNVGTSGGITFNGFVSADATTVTGAVGFDDVSKITEGMTFANATSVGGSGTITSVVGSFADNTGLSSASNIAYSGFGAVTGSGGNVTGVTGSFDLGTKTSAASGINYSGFNVTTLSGSGAGATIAGSGQTYTLDNTIANQGSSGGVNWTGFGNITDNGGTVLFGTGGSLSGNVTAAALNYGSYGSAVTFDLAHGSGATTGIGGTWANVSAVTGNGNGAITGSSTFALSGPDAGSAGGVNFAGFTAADATTVTGAQGFDSAAKSSLGMIFANATNVAGSGAITNLGSTAFNLTGTTAGNAGGVGYSGFSSADTTTVTGAAGFDDASKISEGMTFANATSVAGSGTIANVAGSFADNTKTSSASGIAYNGFGAVTGGGGNVTGVTGSFDLGTKVSSASNINYSGFNVATLSGSGTGATIAGTNQTYTLNNTIANQGSSGGVAWTGFGNIADTGGTVLFGTGGSLSGNVTAAALNYGSYGSVVTFDLADDSGATTGIGGTWAGVAMVTGNGNAAIMGSSTFALSGANAGTAGGVNFAGFTAADATTITGAQGFDSAAKSSLGMAFANATSVAGSGAITNLGSTAFNLTGTTAGNAGGVGYSGFSSADTTTVTGAAGFDDVSKLSLGMTFANATSVAGSGTVANVAGSFADNTKTSSASGIAYNGFGAVTGAGGNVTGVTGSFDLGTKTSAASGIDYSGFNVTTLSGSGAGATIAGTNQTYHLTGANAGNNGTLSWTSFGNLSDSGAGTFVFANGAGVSGMLTSVGAGTLDYSAYTTAVNVGLGGTATNTGGWSGITTVTGGSASDTISGSNQTYHLTGLNAGNNGTVAWSSFENVQDAGTGTLSAANQTWGLTGHNQGTVTNLAGTFSGIGNLIDTGTGHFLMHVGADGDVSGNLNGGSDGSLDYTGYTTPVAVNLSGTGTTGVGGTASGISTITASSNLGVQGNVGGTLTITTTGTGTTTTLGATTVGGDLNITASGDVLQTGGALNVAGASTIDAGTSAITLAGGSNDFVGTVNLVGGTTQINDINALTLGAVNTGALTVNAGDLAINGALNSTTANLNSTGTISEGAGGVITTGTLAGSSTGSTTLNGANHIGTLGSFTAAGFNLTNAQALAVTGPVDGGASTALKTTAGDLAINGAVSGTTTTLTSAGAISEGVGGVITAGTLTGSSAGATTLNGANKVGTLGSFTAATFALTNAQTLAVTGPVDGGASTTLKTTAGDLAINGAVTGTTTTLTSAGAISEGTSGAITAGTLTGSSVGATTLNGANHIGTLGSFTAASFALTNAQALAVTGPVNGGASTTLKTTAGDLAINGAVSGTATTLTSAGAISEGTSGVITAGTLTGSSAGATALNGANQVGALGAFTTGGDFAFNNAQSLTVSNAPSANGGASNLTLTTTGAGSDLILASTLTGNTVTLAAGRNISQTTGAIIATTLTGSSTGSTTLNGTNHVGTLGGFTAAGFNLTNAQALAVTGPVDGGASTTLKTTAGDLAINGAVSGTTTTLTSAGAISEGVGGVITAGTLTGSSAGATTLNGANKVGTLGSFTAATFALTNAQTLAVTGPVDGGASATLKTSTGDLAINGAVTGTTTTLTSAGAISEGTSGAITAGTLTGSSVGATTLNGTNHIGTLGSFTAASFALTNAQALAVTGPVSGGASTTLKTTSGDLAINGAVSGTATTLTSAGAISEGAGGVITAGTLSGSAVGPTVLGGASSPNKNMVDTLGNFTSLAGFSMTNDKTLTLASVAGSTFTVNAGTSPFYLSVTHGDLFQLGTAPVYDGVGVWGSTGRMGTGSNPIYVVGTGLQSIANVGLPPAYFYAVDSAGNLLPLGGGFAINVPTASGAGSAQNGIHGDSYIDPSVITANYRSYGIVPSGVRLPPDQQSGCDPDQPDQAACQDPDALGMVMPWPKAPR